LARLRRLGPVGSTRGPKLEVRIFVNKKCLRGSGTGCLEPSYDSLGRYLGTILAPSCWRAVSLLLLTCYLVCSRRCIQGFPPDLSR
jgi:hypothetical protein